MAKISRNIKKFRNAKNITQDELAQQLFVTRQTISGWENGRTQPDIDTLCRLSEIFGVSVEDLIYGEKRFSTVEEQETKSKRTLIILFSIIASVFLGTGLILIFVTYWENFPLAVKTIFSFVPMLVGQAAAIFTFIKHKDSVAWREGASVLWCAGCAATVALIYNIFSYQLYFLHYRLIIAILFLPVIYFFDAISPLPVYYALTIQYSVNMIGEFSNITISLFTVLFFIAGFMYIPKNRNKKDDFRYIAAQWFSVISAGIYLWLNGDVYSVHINIYIAVMTAFFLCIYIADKTVSAVSACKSSGILGVIASSVYCIYTFSPTINYSVYKIEKMQTAIIVFAVLTAITVVTLCIIRRKTLFRQPLRAAFEISAFLLIISQYTFILFFPARNHPAIYLLILFAHFIMSVSLIAEGVMASNFFTLNVGLLSIIFLIAYIIFSLIDINIFASGILLVILGGLLFSANYYIVKNGKKVPKGVVSGE